MFEITYPYNAAWVVQRQDHAVRGEIVSLQDLTNGYTTCRPWDRLKTNQENFLAMLDAYCNPLKRFILAAAELERFSDKGMVYLVQVEEA